MTRSNALTMKVTPHALMGWRSTGGKKRGALVARVRERVAHDLVVAADAAQARDAVFDPADSAGEQLRCRRRARLRS